MLKQRVITALVLLAILLPALLHPNTLGFNAIVCFKLALISKGLRPLGANCCEFLKVSSLP